MKKLTFAFLLLITALGYAQNTYTISGTITDIQNKPVSIGDILLFPATEAILVKYTSLLDGEFTMADIPAGNYRLKVSCLGFEAKEQVLMLTKNTSLNIQLAESTTNLDEVEVVAAKPIVTNTNGNLKIDITNPLFSAIPDPMELLAKLPGLQLSPNRESVTVLGKGSPLIYIGNQRISIEEFNALSVDDISTIEIIKNPSVKYEADGRAVLLITRRTGNTEGVKINLSETVSFKRNFNNYNSLNGSFKKKKLTLKANFAYNDLQLWESHQFEFGIPEADILSDYLVVTDKGNRVQINMGAGLFYQINETDYFSANATMRLQADDYFIDTDTFLRQGTSEDDIITKTDNENTKDFFSGNMNYYRQLNAQTNIFAGVQFSSFVQRLDTDISNDYNATEFIRSQDRQQKYRIQVLAYRLDFEKIFENDLKWEIGANISDARANALTAILFFEPDSDSNIDYDYTENNYAGYTQLSGALGEKMSFNAGLRAESNVVKGAVEDEDIPLVNRKKTNLFPKALLNFEIDSTKSLTFNYAKSIDRPNYSRASSISVFINPFLEGQGNVNLLPTVTEEVAVTYQFNNNSLSVEYSKRKNPLYYTIGYVQGAEQATFSLNNLEKETGLDISITLPITKGIWTASNFAMLSTLWITDEIARINSAKPYLYLYTDHQFKIGKDSTISIGGWGFTKRSEGIFERNAMVVLNAGITKTLFKKLNCSLRFNDITRAMNFEERYAINGVFADGVYFADGREIVFSVKYALGKTKDAIFKNKAVDENLDRIK
ncbi:TonB-dependent receptor [Maribacter sp.]|nr:TonB-dependent receptor [Maribacter sp.]